MTDHLRNVSRLANTYVAMRHGTSMANAAGRIVSDFSQGEHGWGLTWGGREEARIQVRRHADAPTEIIGRETLVYSSDFLRCAETAMIVGRGLERTSIEFRPELRERSFGEFEGRSAQFYETVWYEDHRDPAHTRWGVESVLSVLDRMTRLVLALDAEHVGRRILLVSHGDPLQILQTAFDRIPPSRHREIRHLAPAEIRPFVLKVRAG